MSGSEFKDETGKRYGQWTVLARAPNDRKSGGASWRCVCSCGREGVVFGGALRGGSSTGCGCQQMQKARRTAKERGSYMFDSRPPVAKSMSTLQRLQQSAATRSKTVKISLAPVRFPEERE